MHAITIAAAIGSMLLATASDARDLPVPIGKGWRHAETNLTLAAALDGMPRTTLTDSTADEHDVTADFHSADGRTSATVYIFHPGVFDVGIWFDRAEAAIYDRAMFGDVAPSSAGAIPVAPPGGVAESGLKRIYSPGKGPFRSTALAVLPLNDWLVAIRLSSKDDAPSALDARLTRIIAAIKWPMPSPIARAATLPVACAEPLAFAKAKRVKPQGADVLLSLLLGVAASGATKDTASPEAKHWCRDPASTSDYGVYRDGRHAGYLIAIRDAGRTVNVTPTLAKQTGEGDGYNVSLTDVDGRTSSYPGFDRLPAPGQVLASLDQALGTARDKTITLDSKTFR